MGLLYQLLYLMSLLVMTITINISVSYPVGAHALACGYRTSRRSQLQVLTGDYVRAGRTIFTPTTRDAPYLLFGFCPVLYALICLGPNFERKTARISAGGRKR